MAGQNRIETLDIFRGIAILLVVLFHYTARLPAEALNMAANPQPAIFFGWIGVFFFFVISGYCIYLTLERASTVQLFLARRFSRLYPAFLAAVLLLFILGLIVAVPSVPEANYREIAPGFMDVALNLVFLGELGEWVNGSFWSIAVEIKFYVLTALLAALFGTGARFMRVFFWLSLLLAALWMGLAALAPGGRLSAASLLQFLTIAPFLPFFALGILARQRQTGTLPAGPWVPVMVVTCLLVLPFMVSDTANLAESVGTVVIFGLLIWLFLRFTGGHDLPHMPLLSGAMARMGLVSYSWYLIHETTGFAIMAAAGPYLPVWGNVLFATVATLLAALAFSAAVEWRFRKSFEKLALSVLTLVWPIRRTQVPAGE